MSEDGTEAAVSDVVERIVDEIAKDTGVEKSEVAKILERLGIRTAVSHRLDVTVSDARLAVGPLHL